MVALVEPKAWAELSEGEREQLGLMLFSLKEFSYGLDRLTEVSDFAAPGVAMVRFYMSSLYHYFAAYFLVGGAHKLRDILIRLGNADLLGPIEELLELRIGELSVGDIVKSWRDKALVHQAFDMRILQSRILSRAELDTPAAGAQLAIVVSALFRQTQALYVGLALRYPEVLAEETDDGKRLAGDRPPSNYPNWERYYPKSGVKQAGRFRSDILICENPACPSEGRFVSEKESFYLFATQPLWRRILGFGSLYQCPLCRGKRLKPPVEGTW